MADITLDDDMESSAMMEAMGFTGFGMQPSAKKRKFNPHADASISGTLPKKPTAASGTGANTAPLGARRLPPASASLPARPSATVAQAADGGNADEIDLGDEDDDDDGGGDGDDEQGGVGTTVGGQEEASGGEPGPQYIDTSRPSRGYLPEELEDMEMQSKIDAIVTTHPLGISALAMNQVRKPEAFQHTQRQDAGRGSGRTGVHAPGTAGAPWWEGYSDTRMNENPWEKLERQKGLEPRGTWISRHNGANAGSAGMKTSTVSKRGGDGEDTDGEKGPVPKGASLDAGGDS